MSDLVAEGWASSICFRLSYLHPDLNDAVCLMTCIALPGNSRRRITVLAYDLGLRLGRVERLLRGLTRQGLVVVDRGRGGGARLARPLDTITLREILEAIQPPQEQSVDCRLGRDFDGLIGNWLATHTLDDLVSSMRQRFAAAG